MIKDENYRYFLFGIFGLAVLVSFAGIFSVLMSNSAYEEEFSSTAKSQLKLSVSQSSDEAGDEYAIISHSDTINFSAEINSERLLSEETISIMFSPVEDEEKEESESVDYMLKCSINCEKIDKN